MSVEKKNNTKIYLILIFLFFLSLLFFFIIDKFQKTKILASEPITIKLITSVHPNLPWNFQPTKSEIVVKPGDVTRVEYLVENFGNKETTGVATLAYYPNEFGNYINKINCFCYDAQTLKPKQQNKFTLILLVDPKVAKDSRTKNIKEGIIQFTFFDYKKYKENKN